MTTYAPPYALRVITVIRGTVASANAYRSFAPWRMIPPYSCSVPGRKPGTSTNVTIGMLNASQNRTNRDAFSLASMSSVPASTFGWFADDADRAPVQAREPDHDVHGPQREDLQELAVVDDAADHLVHVVRLLRASPGRCA